MSTIGDVAKRAGVSAMTVSRVINNSGYISQETRERVEQAIAELGYVPNALARSLRFKQTKTLGLVITDITNPFFTTMARGVEDVASQQGFSVIFCNTDESRAKQAQYLNVLAQKQVDGMLLVPAYSAIESVLFLQERGIPVVVLDRRIPDALIDTVRCDSAQGAYDLIWHLLDLGHRQLTVLSGPLEVSTAADRVQGCIRAFQNYGLGEQPITVMYGMFTVEDGYKMAQDVLRRSPYPSAIFAANNFIAIGALRALREAGLRVPEDISLVTFDDTPTHEPYFTAAAQPAYEMGQRATMLLLDRLAGQADEAVQEIILPTQVIIRQTSAPPRPNLR